MTYRQGTVVLTVDGVRTEYESFGTLHGVDNPIGQCTLTVRTPLPAHLTSGTGPIGKRVVLTATQASHDGWYKGQRLNLRQESSVIFTGTIRANAFAADPSGQTRSYRCEDDLWMFGVSRYEPQAWQGSIRTNIIIRGLLQSKGYGTGRRQPMFLDTVTGPDGGINALGGIRELDDGQIVLKAGTSPLSFMRSIAEPYGYALFALPTGSPRLSRVMGIPPAVGVTDRFRADGGYRVIRSTDEGFSYRGGEDAEEETNYWEVFGASWTTDDGTAVDIRSFPATAALLPDIPDDLKIQHREYSSPFIVNQRQADNARKIREMDSGGRVTTTTIELDGMPGCYPGHLHRIDAPELGLANTFYVMTVAHAGDSRGGYRTTVTYRRGAGAAQPAGVDVCVFRSLFLTPIHLGDEYVGWYGIPSPSGTTKTYTFTPTVEQTALAFVATAHGCNSQYTVKPPPDNLTGSKIVLEQPAGTVIGQNELPVLDERYTEQRDYRFDSNWTDIQVAIPGTLKPGIGAVLKIVAGTDGVGVDDFEIRVASLMSCEEGQPTLPVYPRPPGSRPPRQEPGSTLPGTTTPTTQPSGYLLVQDGPASPNNPLYATKSYTVPQGTTNVRLVVTATGLQAGTGQYGAQYSEFFVLTLRAPNGTARDSLRAKLLNASNVPQSGSGERHADFNVSAIVAGAARNIELAYTYIASENVTITLSSWRVYLS